MAECISFTFTITQGILLVPLYLRFISLPLYGAWLATGQVLGWLALVDPGADMVVRQRVARAFGGGDIASIGGWIGSGVLINTVAGLAILLVSLILAVWVPAWFGLEDESANELRAALRFGAVAASLTTAGYSLASPLQALQRPVSYCVSMIAANVAGISASVLLLFAGWGVAAIPLSWLVRGLVLVIGCGLALWRVWSNLGLGRVRVSVSETFEILRLSAFTFVSKAGYMLQSSSDALLAGVILGPIAAAKLTLTGRLIDALRTFPERLGSAAQPSLAHVFGEADNDRSRCAALRFLRTGSLAAALFIALGVALNKQAMAAWVGEELFAGYRITLTLGIAGWILTVTNLGNHVLFADGAIEKPAKAFLAYGLVKFALVILFAHSAGMEIFPLAAIAAAALTYGRQVLNMIASSPRIEGNGYTILTELSRPFAVCLAIAVGSWWFTPGFGPQWFVVGSCGVSALFCMLVGLSLVANRQMQELRLVINTAIAQWKIARQS